jgi:class 3 adenylate cyclase
MAEAAAATSISATQTVTELRTMTCWLLVADIIDSTRLVQELPPDELPLVTGQWLADCKQTIESSGGQINQFLGDGFFGFWRDRERVEPAIHGTLQALQRLQEQGRPPFRLVLHRGSLVIGGAALGEEERLSGSEVHFVFRMEKLARALEHPRLLSEPAWARLAPLLEATDVGTHPLPGFEGPFRFFTY